MNMKDYFKRSLHNSSLLRAVYIRNRFRVERQLLNGLHETTNEHRSIIHFSLNRSATQYTKSILCRCGKENGMTPAHFNEYAFETSMPYLDQLSESEMKKYIHIFKPRGYVYTVFGGFVHGVPNLNKYHILLMVRDPRDVLTSTYFSNAFSHPLPGDRDKAVAFGERRALARNISIDEYVLTAKDRYADRYRTYANELKNMPNVYITKYEDMISNFPTWLDHLIYNFSLSISSQAKSDMIREANESGLIQENKTKHRRQVLPGDHKRKLSDDTINRLTEDLADILNDFGYV